MFSDFQRQNLREMPAKKKIEKLLFFLLYMDLFSLNFSLNSFLITPPPPPKKKNKKQQQQKTKTKQNKKTNFCLLTQPIYSMKAVTCKSNSELVITQY